MSNRKVREQLENAEIKSIKYSDYKKIETFILNYQMCKAYFHDQSASIFKIVERILREKYNLSWQLKFIRSAVMEARGKYNPLISIPQFKYEEKTHDILSKFVKRNFESMVADQRNNKIYPFQFRDLMEKKS